MLLWKIPVNVSADGRFSYVIKKLVLKLPWKLIGLRKKRGWFIERDKKKLLQIVV